MELLGRTTVRLLPSVPDKRKGTVTVGRVIGKGPTASRESAL